MQTRTYTERSNARRAARAAGLDPDAVVVPCEDGFEVRFEPREQHEPASLVESARRISAPVCTYPDCKCIVSTSTSQPEPICPKGLERDPSLVLAVNAAIERGISPKEFVKIAEGVADALDGIPDFCKITPEKRKESWIKNPPKAAAANLREVITMAKTKAKEKKPKGKTGSDKTATLLSMLKGKGSTVEAMTKALDWLPHTLRARISRLPKEDKKIKIERERVDGVTSYRIAS